jgi:hypothetical protein
MTRYAFVLGTGRCGSTLVQEVVSRHPDVAFVSNLDDRFALPAALGRWNNTLYRRVPPALTRKGRFRFAPSEAYRVLDRKVSPALTMPSHDLTEADATPWLTQRTREFFDEHAARQRGEVFLHKFTGWPRVGFLDTVFPESRYVHVVRDGRAVANSWLQMPWWRGHLGPDQWHFGPLPEVYEEEWHASGDSFVVLAGLAWKLLLDAFDRARELVPADRWLEVRYEDVAADPVTHIAVVREFLGLAPDDTFDRTVAEFPFSTGRTDAYRRDLPEADVDLLTQSLAPRLRDLGYPVED